MPTHLLLTRHAKSSWADPGQDDHDRPLNSRGREACATLAGALHARGLAPDVIWCSSAERTRETATRLMRALPGAQTVEVVPEFYHASADRVLGYLAGRDAPGGKLMLLGHNPGWQSLVEAMSGEVRRMPTGATMVLERKQNAALWWQPQLWRAVDWLTPKGLGGR